MPGCVCQTQTEFGGKPFTHLRTAMTQRGQGTRRTAKLRHQQSWLHLGQTLPVSQQRCAPARDLETEACGRGLLHPRPGQHHSLGVVTCQIGQSIDDGIKVALKLGNSLVQHQNLRGIQNILRGCTPVDRMSSLPPHSLPQLPDKCGHRNAS